VNTRSSILIAALLAISLAAVALGAAVLAQTGNGLDLSWSTVDGGGGLSLGGGYAVQSSVGQADAGRMAGGSYVFTGGFLSDIEAPTPSPTPTSTENPVASATSTSTAAATSTATATGAPSATQTPGATSTGVASATPTGGASATPTAVVPKPEPLLYLPALSQRFTLPR
jgi:hypothetical protein